MADDSPSHPPGDTASPRTLVVFVVKGFCMGAADVVPGVSGGTMALILGIYERLLKAIRAFDMSLLGTLARMDLRGALAHVDAWFLGALFSGLFAALIFFTRVVPLPQLITTHPQYIYALFFGLIIGSVVILFRELPAWKVRHFVALIVGAIAGWLVVTLVPVNTPDSWWFITFSGALAISAMILPGISGSFILLILQKYAYIFDAIGRFDFSVIIPFAAGCAVGLMAFSRILNWLLTRYHQATLTFIIGLLVASLWRIWPFQERVFISVRGKERLIESNPVFPVAVDGSLLVSALLMLAGLATVLIISAVARRRSDES